MSIYYVERTGSTEPKLPTLKNILSVASFIVVFSAITRRWWRSKRIKRSHDGMGHYSTLMNINMWLLCRMVRHCLQMEIQGKVSRWSLGHFWRRPPSFTRGDIKGPSLIFTGFVLILRFFFSIRFRVCFLVMTHYINVIIDLDFEKNSRLETSIDHPWSLGDFF